MTAPGYKPRVRRDALALYDRLRKKFDSELFEMQLDYNELEEYVRKSRAIKRERYKRLRSKLAREKVRWGK